VTADIASIFAQAIARDEEENRLLDEYLKIADRPRHIEMLRDTETSPLAPTEVMDYDHWIEWYLARTKFPWKSL
jgi:hypothetical protein